MTEAHIMPDGTGDPMVRDVAGDLVVRDGAADPMVHVVLPDGVDDPARPSGGNVYDRRVCRELAAIGWSVREYLVPGSWPRPDAAARAVLASVIAGIPDGATVLLDGLVASTVPEVLVPVSDRLNLVVLVHLPLGDGVPDDQAVDAGTRERAVLSAASAVITTSGWTRDRLLHRYALRPSRVHVAEPGVDAADLVPGTPDGGRLLCVAAVAPHKGHDVLLTALAMVADRPWHCECVGRLDSDPDFVDQLRRQAREDGIDGRVRFAGPRAGGDLDAAYAAADVLVLASRGETYGMVVTEALARGIPVVATAVGGLPEALGHGHGHGHGSDASQPGLLVRPGDPAAFAAALRAWLSDADLRQRLRYAAGQRRLTLSGWPATAARIAHVLARAGHPRPEPAQPGRLGSELAQPEPAQPEPVRVSPVWLALREPADAAARAGDLVEQVRGYLPDSGRAIIHDLGCGTGSLGRWLVPRLAGAQHWVLYDRDADLLAAVDMPTQGLDGAAITVETRQRDITRLDPGDLTGACLVTASALLDMLTADELERFVASCVDARCPALVALSVTGTVELSPVDPLDQPIADAFNAHQRRTTGGRRLLGPDAVGAAVDAFTRRGASVLVRPSPWRLGADQAALAGQWLAGWVGAACQQRPELTAVTAEYLRRRLAEAAAGQLGVTVGHDDLLAWPG